MSVLHRTSLTPSKAELLTAWLPTQPWFVGGSPEIERAGGFRLDDPTGEVGIEFFIARDDSGDEPVTYLAPMTYRAAALPGPPAALPGAAAPLLGAASALIGTTEHGVLGHRFVYDAPSDPVFVAELVALLAGSAVPQSQRESNEVDPTVVVEHADGVELKLHGSATDAAQGDSGIPVTIRRPDGSESRGTAHILRVLEPNGSPDLPEDVVARVTAGWATGDGTDVRGTVAIVREGVA
jgi:Maltokinase N-terminal cap domain